MKYITKKSKIYRQAKKILREYDIRYSINWNDSGSYAVPWNNYIKIGLKTKNSRRPDVFLSTVCHEISHIVSYRTGKYKVYHSAKLPRRMTIKELKIWIATALKAERYTDKCGKRLMFKLFPDYVYESGYNTTKGVSWFRRNYVERYKEELKRRQSKRRKKHA
jgi:hypothetical protein